MRFTIELILRTHEGMTPSEVKELLYEQWQQCPAHGEGDVIYVNSVKEIEG